MWVFYSAIQSALDLKRVCKKCKRSQVVKITSKWKVVKCNNCGNDIPPHKHHARG